jgi:hypothetical protein
MRRSLLAVVLPALAACSIFGSSPASSGSLRAKLAAADTSRVEDAARACLTKQGWKVDPVGGLSGGANIVSASKAKNEMSVYIQPPEITPRVTGGPDYGDPFWSCLGGELASASAPPSAASDAPDPPETPAPSSSAAPAAPAAKP